MKDNPVKNDKLPPSLRQTAEKDHRGEAGITIYEYNGIEKMVGYAPVKSAGWSLAVTMPLDEALEGLQSLKWISLATIVAVLAIAFVLIALFARRIAAPIRVIEAARRQNRRRRPYPDKHRDKFQRRNRPPGQKLRNNDSQRRSLIRRIADESQHLAASAEQLTASAGQSSQAANQIAASIASVSEGADVQLRAAEEAAAAVERMSAGIEQVAAVANQSATRRPGRRQSPVRWPVGRQGRQPDDPESRKQSTPQPRLSLSWANAPKRSAKSSPPFPASPDRQTSWRSTPPSRLPGRGAGERLRRRRRRGAQTGRTVRGSAKKIADLIGEIQGTPTKRSSPMDSGTREVKTGAEVFNAAGAAFREIAGW
jgi:methyl-accepting chemotaxis protein